MAQAFSSFDTYLAPFVKVDNLSYEEVKQCIQCFVYAVNTPSRWGTQAPFTNITLDWTVPNDLAELNCIVGGKEMDFCYKDCKKEMDMINKAFIEIMIEGDANGRGFQYPIPTYSITKDFDWSETENNRLLFEMTAKYGTPYFSNYINSDMEPSDIRSMCPLAGDTEIMVRSVDGVSIQAIQQVAKNQMRRNSPYEVWTPDGWRAAKFNQQPMTKMYAIELSNGDTILMGENHLQPTRDGGVKSAKDLQVGEWLPFNRKPISSESMLGTYDLGFAVGAYAGDGSHDDGALVYSLDRAPKDDETERRLVSFWNRAGYKTTVTYSKKVRFVRVNGNAYDVISLYVEGGDALTKKLSNKVFDMSIEFREGVVDGFRFTDGARARPRIYTSSRALRNSLLTLFATLGRSALGYYQDNRPGRLGSNTNYRVDYPSRVSLCKYCAEDENFNYCQIKNIYETSNKDHTLYCLEVDNPSHIFMLANGMFTHNCRLRLDLRELRKKSGGYFGSGESTGCYDNQTEILTQNRGWIKFEDLTKEDVVYTRNPDGQIEMHHPTNLFKYEVHDDLYHFKNSRFDAMVTANHRMVYTDKHTEEQKFVRADEYSFTKHGIPRLAENTQADAEYFTLPAFSTKWDKETAQGPRRGSREWPEIKIPMTWWLRFLGLFISEGSTDNDSYARRGGYGVYVSQKKPQNLPYIENVLNHLPFRYKYEPKRGVYTICSRQLWEYCRHSVMANLYEARIPREYLTNCSSDELQCLLEGLMIGDGSYNKTTGQATYYTVSKQLIDDMQELLILTGHACVGIRQHKQRDSIIKGRLILKENCATPYEITISRVQKFYLMPENITKERYDGYVYCCEVPNHTVMVRRNGKCTWCGNSIGVVSVNLPRLGYLSENEKDFYERLDKIMDISARSLDIKRKAVSKWLDEGLYPYTKRYLGDLHNHFSTIATVGGNECCLNAKWIGKDLSHPESQQFMKDVLNHMRERLSDYQEKYGDLFNLEAAPAESTAYRFAKHDKERYPDIITAESMDGVPYYTNSTHLPVGYTEDVFTALEIQDELQTLYTSGTVFHAFLGEKLPDWKAAATLVRKIAENFKLPYYTISPTYSVCSEHGYINGEVYRCPKCGKTTEVYSRITGYYRPVQNWNDGKMAEFKMRKTYEIAGGQNFFQPMVKNDAADEIEEQCSECVIPKRATLVLYGTKTCPNCKAAAKFMDDRGIEYEKKYAEDDPEFGLKHGIRQAPTLVEEIEDKVRIVTNLSNIMKYIRESY